MTVALPPTSRVPTPVRWDHAWTIAHLEMRRRFRTIRANVWQLIAFAIIGLFVVPLVGGVLFGFLAFGAAIADGSIDAPLQWTTMGIAGLWSFVVLFGGYRAYSNALRPDHLDGMLTTISHRDLIAGLLVAELVLWGVPSLILATLAATAFAVGSGSIAVLPSFLLVVAVGLSTGLLAGFAAALVVRNLGVRSVLLTRLRNAFVIALFALYIAVLVGGAFDDLIGPAVAVLSPTPVGWLADLVLLPVVAEASPLRAIGAVLANLAGLAVVGIAVSRLAAALWYADGVTVTHRSTEGTERGARLERLVSRPVASVALVDWTRAKRAPITLSFALYPLAVLIGPLTDTLQSGSVGSGFPLWVMLCGAWITGVLFTLNVLGNEAPALEGTILAANVGRSLVAGHLLAAILLAGIPTVVATVTIALASPLDAIGVALFAVATLVLVCTAAMVATGIGVAFPRFEAVSVTRGTTAIVPSWIAFVAFSLVLLVLSLPAVVGFLFLNSMGTGVAIVGVTATAIAGIGAGAVSAHRAMRRIDTYVLDD